MEAAGSGGTKIGRVFKKMGTLCPFEIATYGKCLVRASDVVEKNVCQQEFEALKRCFRKARAAKV
jgi:hypothetical protein